jgi:hypothetical protein
MTRDMMEMSNKNNMHPHCPMMMQGTYLQPQTGVQSQMMHSENMHGINCSECPMKHMHMHEGPMHGGQEPSTNYMLSQHQTYMAPYMNPYMMDPDNALMHLPMMPPAMPQMLANIEDEDDDSDDEDNDDYRMYRSYEEEAEQADTNNILRAIQRNDQSIFGTLDMYGVPQSVADSIVSKIIKHTLDHSK